MKIIVLIVKSDKETIEKKTYAYTHKHEGKTSERNISIRI